MHIVDISILSGPNIYSYTPVIRMLVDLEHLADKTTVDFEDFNEMLLKLLPGLEEHHCGLGKRGGFLEKLRTGTYFGHVFEHITLELQVLVGYEVFFGKTRLKESPSLYNIIFEYGNENVGIECAKQSIHIIKSILKRETIDMDQLIKKLIKVKEYYELGPSSKAIFDEAKKRGIPVRRFGSESILELGYGKYLRKIQAALVDSTSCIAVDIACDKQLTKQLLERNNIPAEDISIPLWDCQGAVIEVNAAPGLRMHLHPTKGKKKNVAADILDLVYPKGAPYSIPIVAVTGTNGKTTTTRLIRHTLARTGKIVGMTTSHGIYIGDRCILEGDNTGPVSARTVLSSKEVEVAVLEVARGGIIKRGLGYDFSDIGVITNISDDHIGLDGVDTIEDLAFVKSLIIESVKPDGYSVLNAEDKMVEFFIKRARGNIMLFSKSSTNRILTKHIENGGIAAYVKDHSIYICNKSKETKLIDINDIPITLNGAIECNIENALSAACALYGLNVPLEEIRNGFMCFQLDANDNMGRFNIFDLGNFKVMLDYGHNIGSYEAVGKFVRKLDASRIVGIIGMPGDRTDESILKVGAKCSEIFSKVYIKEDMDLRGRAPGEVANILYKGLMGANFCPENVEIILSEIEALKAAIAEAQAGDLIVLFYEEFEPAFHLVSRLQSQIQKNMPEQKVESIDIDLLFPAQSLPEKIAQSIHAQ